MDVPDLLSSTRYKCPKCGRYKIKKVYDSDRWVCWGDCDYEFKCAKCSQTNINALVRDKDSGDILCLHCVFKMSESEPMMTEQLEEKEIG